MCEGCHKWYLLFRWIPCCRIITDPVCRRNNKACRQQRDTATTKLNNARSIFSSLRDVVSKATSVLNQVVSDVTSGQILVKAATSAYEEVKKTFNAITNAFSYLKNYGLSRVFDIKKVSFDVALSTAATESHIQASVVVNIFRQRKEFSLDINFRSIRSFVEEIGENAIQGLKGYLY